MLILVRLAVTVLDEAMVISELVRALSVMSMLTDVLSIASPSRVLVAINITYLAGYFGSYKLARFITITDPFAMFTLASANADTEMELLTA